MATWASGFSFLVELLISIFLTHIDILFLIGRHPSLYVANVDEVEKSNTNAKLESGKPLTLKMRHFLKIGISRKSKLCFFSYWYCWVKIWKKNMSYLYDCNITWWTCLAIVNMLFHTSIIKVILIQYPMYDGWLYLYILIFNLQVRAGTSSFGLIVAKLTLDATLIN